MTSRDEILTILTSIQQGAISPTEGLKLIHSIDGDNAAAEPAGNPPPQEAQEPTGDPDLSQRYEQVIPLPVQLGPGDSPSAQGPVEAAAPDPSHQGERVEGQPVGEKEAEREINYWKRWWLWPFWVGVAITFIGALVMYAGYLGAGFGFFFWLAWVPFFLGVLIIALSWQNKGIHWLHVRVHQRPGEKPATISISLPLPLGIAKWFLRNFSHLIPGLRDQKLNGVDYAEIITSLENNLSADNPFYVHVNDEGGEEVEVYIG